MQKEFFCYRNKAIKNGNEFFNCIILFSHAEHFMVLYVHNLIKALREMLFTVCGVKLLFSLMKDFFLF